MKLCISSLAWNNTDRITVYELLKKNNISCLEIVLSKFNADSLNETVDFYLEKKQEWESFGLKAVSIQSIHFGVTDAFLFGTEKQREHLLHATKRIINIASALQIENIVFGSPKLRISPAEDNFHEAIVFFTELNQYASTKNCFINIEANSSQYGTNFLTTTQSVKDFVYTHSWSNIGINLDLSTIILEEENIDQVLFDIHHVKHVHISVPFLKTNFSDFLPQIEQFISRYKTACESRPDTLNVQNSRKLSIEMISQETDLELLQNTINLVKRYL